MPFEVLFEIRNKSQMPVSTYDRKLAYIKYNEFFKKDPETKFSRTVKPVNLTGPEKFVYLTYQVMNAIRAYFDKRFTVPKEEEKRLMEESLDLEKQLDLRITEGRFYLQSHPKAQTVKEQLDFFLLVETWRKTWKEYFRYKKLKNKDPEVEKQLKNQCFAYERDMSTYIQKKIGL